MLSLRHHGGAIPHLLMPTKMLFEIHTFDIQLNRLGLRGPNGILRRARIQAGITTSHGP